ncbi:MAG: response regulator [FCB group bacterium]|nr:response regulator [FCB group bacterium]
MPYKILMVEDDKILLSIYSNFLREQDMEVVTALDGLEALEILRNEQFDLLITDIGMPKISGIELIRRCKDSYPGLPSIIITGHATPKDAVEAINLKVARYFTKPIPNMQALTEAAVEAIESNRNSSSSNSARTEADLKIFRRVVLDTYVKPRFGLAAAGIAHNINSPLGGVMGYAQLTEMKHPNVKGLDMISDQAQKVAGLLHRVGEKGHADNNRRVSDIDLISVCEIEERFLDFNLFFKHNVEVVRNYEEIPAIKGIYLHFSQIFNHLVQNAADAVFESSRKSLTISLQHLDDSIIWTFEDSGEGIPAINMDRVFEPGFTTRLSPEEVEDSEMPSGYGMGLYVVKEILDEIGGTIEIESVINKGTKIIVKLPLET